MGEDFEDWRSLDEHSWYEQKTLDLSPNFQFWCKASDSLYQEPTPAMYEYYGGAPLSSAADVLKALDCIKSYKPLVTEPKMRLPNSNTFIDLGE